MGALRAMTSSFLCAAGLLLAVFALIVGILGMHVMTGTHSAHATAAATPSTKATAISTHAEHAMNDVAASAHCSCASVCTDQHATSVTCTPSVSTGVLAAPAADTSAPLTATLQAVAGTAVASWMYRPGGPSPGELSISRT